MVGIIAWICPLLFSFSWDMGFQRHLWIVQGNKQWKIRDQGVIPFLSERCLNCWKNLRAPFPRESSWKSIWLGNPANVFLPGGYYLDRLWKYLLAFFSFHPDVCTSQMFTMSSMFSWSEELSLSVSVGLTYMGMLALSKVSGSVVPNSTKYRPPAGG